MHPSSWLCLNRSVRFGDTDPAGVIHFYQLFRWSHEAWEESLEKYGILSSDVFPKAINYKDNPPIALPIIHCEADYRSPIKTGDNLDIELIPKRINPGSFQVVFEFKKKESFVAKALLRHLSIKAETNQRCILPEGIDRWLEASSIDGVIASID